MSDRWCPYYYDLGTDVKTAFTDMYYRVVSRYTTDEWNSDLLPHQRYVICQPDIGDVKDVAQDEILEFIRYNNNDSSQSQTKQQL